MSDGTEQGDIAALAKGGKTNVMGFLLRLLARLPFLFIAGRLYGVDALGRFASALVIIELMAIICSMGEKRGLAQRLSESKDPPANLIFDAVILTLFLSCIAGLFFWFVPAPMFPSDNYTWMDKLLVLAIPAYAITEIALAAQAYRYDIATTVRARAVVEPWTISILAGVFFFVIPDSGLEMAYLASIYAGLLTALWPMLREYGLPQDWHISPSRLTRLGWRALPLATADVVEWGTRRLDVFILGLIASPSAVGIYYVAQQVASLPQKLKTSFEPVLSPVITRNLKEKNYAAIARQVSQVGFWIIAAQMAIALSLAIPGEAVMGLFGPSFVGGTGALALLLIAEVVASTAVVAESALVYMARLRNLWISVATIALQGALTILFIHIVVRMELGEPFKAAAAAGALALSLGCASLVKARFLSHLLGHPINNWRWWLIGAAIPASLIGALATILPEWMELILGIPAILVTYCWVIWNKGFDAEDRIPFKQSLTGNQN